MADLTLEARRRVAETCLYGVDKNPEAVTLVKLSLWLVTLAKDKPFSFLDHCLKSGDSLVGLSMAQIEAFSYAPVDEAKPEGGAEAQGKGKARPAKPRRGDPLPGQLTLFTGLSGKAKQSRFPAEGSVRSAFGAPRFPRLLTREAAKRGRAREAGSVGAGAVGVRGRARLEVFRRRNNGLK